MTAVQGTAPAPPAAEPIPVHRARRLEIDTGQEAVVYLHRDSPVCRSEGFDSETRIRVQVGDQSILATLNVVTGPLLALDEAGLSEAAWNRLEAVEGQAVTFAHPAPLESLRHVRAKIYGKRLDAPAVQAIVGDIAAGAYSDVHLASFLTACGDERLDRQEMIDLTRAMIASGERLEWERAPIVDKHSVGGLPGNRTTLLVVPIVTAAGVTMPKTSSRAITSPAGTADTMEMLAPVDLDRAAMRRVVAQEGGCIGGGTARLRPADDVLIGRRARSISTAPAAVALLSRRPRRAHPRAHRSPVRPTAKIARWPTHGACQPTARWARPSACWCPS
jgi:thymidine phosphorylase